MIRTPAQFLLKFLKEMLLREKSSLSLAMVILPAIMTAKKKRRVAIKKDT
jgi:hypothetical protein